MGKKNTDLINQLKGFRKILSNNIRLNKLILFGSRARGNNKKNSDVDVIIVSPDFEGKKSFRRSPPFYLMWNHDYEIDIICLTPEELKSKQKQISIIKQAVEEGIEIK